MFIAHLPAGYLLTDRLTRGLQRRRRLMGVGLVAAVLPDTDLLWFYLVNDRQNLHHDFLFHWPLFWVAVAALFWILGRLAGWRDGGVVAGVALASLLLHMVLDSVVAEIAWLAPFSDRTFGLMEVPDRHAWWVWNFILHGSFGLELAIVALALWTLRRNRR
ncbi:metal-dependent hydrolase [Falsirhodobacter sp. 1013]|uniref:metal-dependent hydrolase n=1 Tax=Falsirhodobacter sp. 1013 TaxID=3417566 RepID=UPI003EBB782C